MYQVVPLCINAQGKCTPEDVGSTWGYTEFREVIKGKDFPEHKETREWYGLEENEEYDEVDVHGADQFVIK